MNVRSASPKRSRKREATNSDGPSKKRRKDKARAVEKRRDDGAEHWAWATLAESSISSLAPVFTLNSGYFFTTTSTSLQIFSTATGKLVSTIPAHSDTITALALHPLESSHLFSASLDGTIKRWDIHTGALLEILQIDQPVTHIAVHAGLKDEVFVAAGPKTGKNADSSHNSSHIFRITTKPASQLPPPETSLSQSPKPHKSSRTIYIGKTRRAAGFAISSCGRFLIVVGGNKAYVAQLDDSGARKGFTSFVSPDALTCLAVHPSEPYFATGDRKGVVRLWYCLNDQSISRPSPLADPSSSSSKPKPANLDQSASAPTTTLHWHAHAVSALSFTPSGAQLLSGGEEAVLVVWQLYSGQRDYVPRVGAPIGGVSVCNGAAGGQEYTISLVDGGIVFVASQTLRIQRTVRRIRLDPTPTRPLPLTFHPRTGHIVIPAAHPSSLQILSRTSIQLGEVQVAPANRISRRDEAPIEPVRVTLVAVGPGKGKGGTETEGEWMATVDSRTGSEFYLKFWRWNPSSATPAPTLNTRIDRPHGEERLTSIMFSPCAELCATSGDDGLVKLWSVAQSPDEHWICSASFGYRDLIPSRVVFSPDGSLLAVTHGPGVTLWDVSDGQKMSGVLACVEVKEPRQVVFVGKSGRYVAVLGDAAIVLWDLMRFCVLWHVSLEHISTATSLLSNSLSPTPTFALVQHLSPYFTSISIFAPSSPSPIYTRTLPFRLADATWSGMGIIGVREGQDKIGWSVVLAGDEVKQTNEVGQGGIGADNTPFVPRTLFEDIFGRGALGNGNQRVSAETEEQKGEPKSDRNARKNQGKAATLQPAGADGEKSDSDGETPESSEPATEGDAEIEVVPYADETKQTPSFVGASDGTIQVTKKVNGIVGIHSASDEDDEEEIV